MVILHLHAAVQELYSAEPGDFMSVRKSLVAQATTAGDAALAASVRVLRKPTVAAWAINHFVRSCPDEIEELHDFAELLREAQRTLDGDQLRVLGRERSRRVEAATRRVVAATAAAGQSLAAGAQSEVRATLTAFVADEAAERTIRTGALVKALTYAGLGSVDITGVVAMSGEQDAALPAVATDLDERRRARDARRRAQLAADLDAAQRARATAQHQVDVATARQNEAREGIADLERRLGVARNRLDTVTAELTRLRSDQQRRQEQEQAAEAALDDGPEGTDPAGDVGG